MNRSINIKGAERRYFNLQGTDLNCRIQKDADGKRHLIGYGSVFNQESRIIFEWVPTEGEYREFFEIIEPQAFDDVLNAGLDAVVSVDHDFTRILGKTKSGTAVFSTDEKGLRYDVLVPNTTLGNDTCEMVERGDFNESSFIFTVDANGQRWERGSDGIWRRYITKVTGLYDCTICSYKGAYANTDIEVAERMLKDVIARTAETTETKTEETQEKQEEPTVISDEEKQRFNDELFLLENEVN